MTETTPRFALPLLVAGQAQKELFHNEAIVSLEGLVHPVAETLGDVAPPVSPAVGQSWIVGTDPSGDWTGYSGNIASWTAGGWRFVSPLPGMCLWIAQSRVWAQFIDGAWTAGTVYARSVTVNGQQVIAAQQPAIAAPAGGSTVDSEARATLNLMLESLREHGLIAR